MLDFSKNHFELFGLPLGYELDPDLLAERYRTFQKALHPDRFATAGDREKRLSMQASTHINEAFRTLRDPLARARYLLLLHTGDTGRDNETTSDMAFLVEQMELRETLAQAKGRPDPYAAVGAVRDRLSDQSSELCGELSERFARATAEGLDQARELVRKLQFVYKCRAEVENTEAELDDAL